MEEYDISTYGERVAEVYDDLYTACDEAMIAALADLARGGRALELGIGTGRVAIPLARLGVEVHGIDSSPAMAARLKEKSEGLNIPVRIGNFADVEASGQYKLVYVVFNTFFGLLTQEEQTRCFASVARHLTSDGVFVIEAFVPDPTRFVGGQTVRAAQVTQEGVNFDVSIHDAANQRVAGQHVLLTEQGVKLFPLQIRYAWPSEMDLMARLAGLRLAHRWGGWKGERFTSDSGKHISVYERAS